MAHKFLSAHSTLMQPKGAPIRWEVWGLPRAPGALGFKIAVCAFSPFSEHHFAQFLNKDFLSGTHLLKLNHIHGVILYIWQFRKVS